MVLEETYACSLSLFKSSTIDPEERTSLLLLDKDVYPYENNVDYKCKSCKRTIQEYVVYISIYVV